MRVAHLAFDLRARHQRRHRVHHHHVDRPAAHQRLGDLQRLLPGVRLRDVQVVHVHPTALRIARVQRVLHVDEGGNAAPLLSLGDDVLAQGGLA